MSQAKVEQYKKEKANRRQIMAKERAKRIAGRVCAWVILLAIVGWAGYSVYSYYESKQPAKTIYANLNAISDYMNGLDPETQAE